MNRKNRLFEFGIDVHRQPLDHALDPLLFLRLLHVCSPCKDQVESHEVLCQLGPLRCPIDELSLLNLIGGFGFFENCTSRLRRLLIQDLGQSGALEFGVQSLELFDPVLLPCPRRRWNGPRRSVRIREVPLIGRAICVGAGRYKQTRSSRVSVSLHLQGSPMVSVSRMDIHARTSSVISFLVM